MSDVFGLGSGLNYQVIAFGLDLALKSAVLLALAILIHAILGRRRALGRSAVWNACLAALLVLPLVVGLSPRLHVGQFVAFDGDLIARAIASHQADAAPRSGRHVDLEAARAEFGREDFGDLDHVHSGASAAVAHARRGPAITQVTSEANLLAIPADRSRGMSSLDTVWLAVAVYGLVAALLAVRLLGSLAAVARLRRSSVAVDNPLWCEGLERWRASLGIDHPVALGRSDNVTVPVAIGWLRPAILVPGCVAESGDRCLVNAVLLHELCHIGRGDYAWNVAWKLAQVVYWPQPLIWLAGPLIRSVRERACDELCVHALGGAQGYRAALIAIAAGLLGPRPRRAPVMGVGMAMARSPRLARRLDEIERMRGRASCRLGRPHRWATIIVVLTIAGVLGAIDGGRQPTPAGVVNQAAEAAPKSDELAKPANPALRPVLDAVELTVVDVRTDKPLAGTTVLNWIDFRKEYLTTNDEGRVRVPRSTEIFRDRVSVDIWKDGYVQQRFGWGPNYEAGPIPERFTVKLLPCEATYGGIVKDEEGRPIAGVLVELWGYLKKQEPHELCYHVRSTTDAQGRWRNSSLREMSFVYLYLSHPNFLADGDRHPRSFGSPNDRDKPAPPDLDRLRKQTDVQVMKRGVELRGRVLDERGQPIANAEVGLVEDQQLFNPDIPKTKSDAHGVFQFAHARPGKLAVLAKASGRAPGLVAVTAGPTTEPVELRLEPGRLLQGRVVDGDGKPIEGAFVNVDSWRGYRCLGVYLVNDRDGRFRWGDAPPDEVRLNVDKTGTKGIRLRDVVAASKEIVFTLAPSIQITGRVRDAMTTKAPSGLVAIERGTVDAQTGELAGWMHDEGMFVHSGHITANLDATQATSFKLRLTAAGYEPFVSRTIRSDEGYVNLDVRLKKLTTTERATGPSGFVRGPDGKPLAGVQVIMSSVESGTGPRQARWVSIAHGQVENADQVMIVTTEPDGRFAFPTTDGLYEIMAVTDAYYARATNAELEASHELKAQPWARIEGRLMIGSKPGAGCYVSADSLAPRSQREPGFFVSDKVQSDAEGRFEIRKLRAENVQLFYGLEKGGEQVWSRGNRIVPLESGKATRVTLGGQGRPVIGRIAPPADFGRHLDFSGGIKFRIESNKPWNYFPPEVLKRDDVLQWMFQASQTREQVAYLDRYVQINLEVAEDGTFRADDMPAGTYRLNTELGGRAKVELTAVSGRLIANLEQFFIVPPMPSGRSDEPLDLGTVTLRLQPPQPLSDGDVAPAIEVATLDGKPLKLADYRGKLVLLNFWAPWINQSLFQIPYLKDLSKTYEGERFAIINLIPDAEPSESRRLAAEVGLPGAMGFLGQWSTSPVIKDYGVEHLPATFLIGPDGKILVSSGGNPTRLWMTQFKDEVAKALKK
jgi:beta-lactamase regulating signal transducer with metallopeptidase domain/thiol-disulfide isomerase/thioredoxin